MVRILDHLAERGAGSIHARGRVGTAALLAELPDGLVGPVLEVGCGTGETSVQLCRRVDPVVAVDASPRMLWRSIERARWCGIGATFMPVHSVGQLLPFADQIFSAVVVESVLAIQPPQKIRDLVREIRRVVRFGGRILVNESVWLSHVPKEVSIRTNEVSVSTLGIIQAAVDPFDAEDWVKMFENEQLRLVSIRSLDQLGTEPNPRVDLMLRSRAYTALKRMQSVARPGALAAARDLKRRLDDVALPYCCLEGVLFVLERSTS